MTKRKYIKISLLLIVLFLLPCAVCAQSEQSYDTNFYLGSPYIADALGEGEGGYSSQPLVRYDGFNCTTYVEMLLAKSRYEKEKDKNSYDFAYWHNLIRYTDGDIGFFSRAHFMELHWIPNALKYSFIKEYPIEKAQVSKLEVDLQAWFLEHPSIKNKDLYYRAEAKKKTKNAQASIAYLPRTYVNNDFIKNLPPYMLVFIIKDIDAKFLPGQSKNKSSKIEMITHMGFLIEGTLYHASSKHKKVVKENFYNYINKNTSIKGIALYTLEKL